MKKRISVMLIASLCVCMCACGSAETSRNDEDTASTANTSIAPKDDIKEDDIKEDDTKEDDTTSEFSSEIGLTKAELDLYGEIQDSNYMSVILYNPEMDLTKEYENVVLAVYDMKADIHQEFQNVKEDNSLIGFGLGSEYVTVGEVICNSNFYDGHASVYETDEIDEKYQFPLVTARIFANTSISQRADLEKYFEEGTYYVYGDNWYSMTKLEDYTGHLELVIAESDEEYKTVQIQLPENVENNESRTDIIDAMVREENFKNTIVELSSMDDLSSVVTYHGKEVNLSETIIYQDLVAVAIADKFGLNLRDKNVKLHSDRAYIKYTSMEGDSVTFEVVNPLREYDSYETIASMYEDDKIEYTDAEGNLYEYF